MKTLSQIREASGDKEAYQKFFNSLLKKFGVKSQAELEGDKKKKFYDALDAGWEGANEKPEAGDKKESVEIKESFDVPAIDYNKLKDYKGFQAINIKKMIKANDFSKFNVKTVQDIILWLNMVAMQWKADNLKESVELAEALSGKAKSGFKAAMKTISKDKEVKRLKSKSDVETFMDYTGMDIIFALDLGDKESNEIIGAVTKELEKGLNEAVSTDCRTKGYKEAVKRSLLRKEKRDIKKEKLDAEKQKECEEAIANSTGVNIASNDKPLNKVHKRKTFKESLK